MGLFLRILYDITLTVYLERENSVSVKSTKRSLIWSIDCFEVSLPGVHDLLMEKLRYRDTSEFKFILRCYRHPGKFNSECCELIACGSTHMLSDSLNPAPLKSKPNLIANNTNKVINVLLFAFHFWLSWRRETKKVTNTPFISLNTNNKSQRVHHSVYL